MKNLPPTPPHPPKKKKLALKHKKGIYKLKIAKISKRKSKPKNKDMQQNLWNKKFRNH